MFPKSTVTVTFLTDPTLDESKPFKGKIYGWRKYHFDPYNYDFESLGYVIVGRSQGHPRFNGSLMRTSAIVKHAENGMVETLNSRYQLVGPEMEG